MPLYNPVTGFTAGGDLTGSNTSQTVAKINGATVPAAGSLTTGNLLQVSGSSATSYGYLVNANVDVAAAIAGTKISPDFGSQLVTTSGNIRADGYYSVGAAINSPTTAGVIRVSYLGSEVAPGNTIMGGRPTSGGSTSTNAPIISQAGNYIVFSDNSQWNTSLCGSTLEITTGSSQINFYNSSNVAAARIGLSSSDFFGPLKLGSNGATFAAAGTIRLVNNSGTVLAQRNAANSADLVAVSINTTDGYVGSDTSKSTNLTNIQIAPSTATNIWAGSTQIAQFISTGTQLGGGSASFGGGTGVAGLTYASINPSTNPSGGIVLYADSTDGYLKYRQASGYVVKIDNAGSGGGGGVSVTGTGLVKAVSGVIQSSASTLLDADVNASAAIAGTKISPNFGSQNVLTSGRVTATNSFATDGYIQFISGGASSGLLRIKSGANRDILVIDNGAGSDRAPLMAYNNGTGLLSFGPSDNFANVAIQGASVALLAGGVTSFNASSSLNTSLVPIEIGVGTKASTGQVRFANNVGNIIAVRDTGNTSNLVALSVNGFDNIKFGSDFSDSNAFQNTYLQGSISVALNVPSATGGAVAVVDNGVILGGAGGTFSGSGGSNVVGIVSAVTAPTAGLAGMAILYHDSADGYLKYRPPTGGAVTLNARVDIEANYINPTTLSANVNNYNPTNLATARTVILDTDGVATWNISGLAFQGNGKILRLVNGNSGNAFISLTHEDTNSTAANRFNLIGNDTIYLSPQGGTVELWYDTNESRWRQVSTETDSNIGLQVAFANKWVMY